MEYIFVTSVVILLYSYIGYFIALWILSRLFQAKKQDTETTYFPKVSVVIAAYNEEKNIEKRITNLLSQEYPKELLEIIVASDGSTDNTVQNAAKFKNDGVVVLDFKGNRGRAAMHNDAVNVATGEIIIFTDAETDFDKHFTCNLIQVFDDPQVGCASGKLIFLTGKDSISANEGLYWKYEVGLRKLEDRLGIFITGTGAAIALRKKVFQPLSHVEDIDDSAPLYIVKQGYSVRFADNALAYDYANTSVEEEFNARIRMTAKGITGVQKYWKLKDLLSLPRYSVSIISHKILKWTGFVFMLIAFFSNLYLLFPIQFNCYVVLFILQCIFYLAALTGYFLDKAKINIPFISTAFSFVLANVCMSMGFFKGLTGKTPAAY